MLRTQESYFEKIAVKASGTQKGTKTSISSFFSHCMEKGIGVYMGVKIFGTSKQYALAIGLRMASLGEFSFIVLKTGKDLGVVSDMLFPIVGMVVVLTTFIGVMMAKKGIKTVEVYE